MDRGRIEANIFRFREHARYNASDVSTAQPGPLSIQMDRLDYDRLAREYNTSLTDKLRGHGAQGTFLEHWVPDEDPIRGLLNMIEAAEIDRLDAISIQVSAQTLGMGDLGRLREMAEGLASIDITAQEASFLIEATGIGRQSAIARRGHGPSPSSTAAARNRSESSGKRRETAGIHPSLAANLATAHGKISREGLVAVPQGSVRYLCQQDGDTLSLDVMPDGRIAQARHQAIASADRKTLVDLMCQLIEGRTVQDASDHAGILVIDRLRTASGTPRTVPGVLLVANAGQDVAAALRLVRGACQAHAAATGAAGTANFFEAPPAPQWLALKPEARLERISAAVAAFIVSGGWPSGTIQPLSLDEDLLGYPVRVLVELGDGLSTQTKPSVLRDLERWLKGRVEPKLQVHLAPLKDKNSIRRL